MFLTVACFESTNGVLAERRLKTLRELDAHTASAHTMDELGKSIGKAFTFNPYDVPFALIYFCSSEFEIKSTTSVSLDNASSHTETDKTDPLIWTYRLQDTVGIPEGHSLAPKVVEVHGFDYDHADDHFWPFREMAEEQAAVQLQNISPETLHSIQHQGWPELPNQAIAVPILGPGDVNGKEALMGMLIMGINPRRTFDEIYQEFCNMCSRQISAAMITSICIQKLN